MINNLAEWVDIKDRKPTENKKYVIKYKHTELSDEYTTVIIWKGDSFFDAEELKNVKFYSFYWLEDNAAVV